MRIARIGAPTWPATLAPQLYVFREPLIIGIDKANLRGGPGTQYSIVATAVKNQNLGAPIGFTISNDGIWWEVPRPASYQGSIFDGQRFWVRWDTTIYKGWYNATGSSLVRQPATTNNTPPPKNTSTNTGGSSTQKNPITYDSPAPGGNPGPDPKPARAGVGFGGWLAGLAVLLGMYAAASSGTGSNRKRKK